MAAHEQGGRQAARRVDRQTGDVDEREMQHHERQADREAGHRGHALRAGRPENDDDEKQRGDEFRDNGRAEPELAEIAGTPAGLPKSGRSDVVALESSLKDDHQHGGARNAAEQLGHDIAERLIELDATGDQHADGHRRIDVTARDRSNAIGHRHDGETEGKRDRQDADRSGGTKAADDDRPASDEDQRRRPDEFRQILFHC